MRIRTIKPEFWSSETMASLSDAAKLLAIGLLNYCDDEGYFSCNPVLIRSALMPFADDSSIARRLLVDLSRIGYIKLGKRSDDGRSVGWVVNFLIHQRIDRPKASEIKGFFTLDDASTTPRRLIDGEGKGMEGNGRGMEGKGTPLPPEGAGAPIPLPLPPEFNPPIPSALDTPAFQDAWRFWLGHLKQKKKSPTANAQILQLAKLEKFGLAKAIETLQMCVEKNWRGVYEDRQAGQLGASRAFAHEQGGGIKGKSLT